jgi:hypothetical protein
MSVFRNSDRNLFIAAFSSETVLHVEFVGSIPDDVAVFSAALMLTAALRSWVRVLLEQK